MPNGITPFGRLRALLRARNGAGREPSDDALATSATRGDAEAWITSTGHGRRFLIVTPVFNAEAFIDEAIASVLRQNLPDHGLHYHVQDGGSTDGTVDKLRAWQRRLGGDHYIPNADRIRFTFASERDGGMYDALQRGFARLEPRDDDILTWINSDDCLAQGSLVTVGGVFRDVPDCEFLSGRTALLNEAGAVAMLGIATPYAQKALANGLHDGRTLPFVMQEGTFYSGRVWNAVGGVDTSFRLAGDWDLWRRVARVARHCIVDSVTGYHRRRAGQLSSDMLAYYREIDTAPVLPAADLGQLGTFIMYDVATARWLDMAFDPAMVAASRLLRDGRSEVSVICRPVVGFAAPEGPYAQYQLPNGIRWIEGTHGEIALQAPASGRYRLRLTVRPSRDALVIGLRIGGRQSQPITLEPPAPQVDQVIETVRWLGTGENRLVIDCDGPPDARSLLLIRCEATSIDDDFLRRPALPPVRSTPADGLSLAVVILCEDDEPDLLDLSLADCAAAAPDAAIFVVRDPSSTALDRVIQFRQDAVTRCIDTTATPTDVERLRGDLRDAGFRHLLVMPRGSMMTPRGLAAASTLVEITGAKAAIGLVNERDSMGRSLRLSAALENAPVLYRTMNATDASVRIGCALTQVIGRGDAAQATSVVWLLDGDQPLLGRTPATLLAAALTLLGHDVRHIVVEAGQYPAAPSGALVIASQGVAGAPPTAMTIGRDGNRLRLEPPHGGTVIDLPLACDTDLLLPRDRAEARARLGFGSSDRIVCVAEISPEAAAATIARVVEMSGGPTRILNFGNAPTAASTPQTVMALDGVDDPLLLSYFLSAADIAVSSEPSGGMLAGAAWACGIPVMNPSGETLFPEGMTSDISDAPRARDLMVTTRSLASLAIALSERYPALGGETASPHLRSGHAPVRSYASTGQPGGFASIASFSAVTMLDSNALFVAADGERGQSIGGRHGELIVSLDQAGVETLRLHVRGVPGDSWTVHAGGGATTFVIGPDGDAMAAVAGDYHFGPTRVTFERQGDDHVGAPLLHVVGLSQTGVATPVSNWEETRFELVPADALPPTTLEIDGDWQRLAGFLPEQAPVPPVGMYAPFHWNLGNTCKIRVRVTTGRRRTLHLALAAGMRGQRVRPIVAGQAYGWSTPLTGPIGHVERRAWLIDWPVGDIDLTLEISDVLRTMPQEVGLMLFGVTLGRS